MQNKREVLSFSPFVFTRHGAKKGTDRYYAQPDALFHQKRKGFISL